MESEEKMTKKHYKEREAEKLAKREERILERRKKEMIRNIGIILVIISITIPVTVYAYLNLPENETNNKSGNKNLEIEWYNYEEGMSISESENKPVMIDFYYEGCGWCDELDETTYKNLTVINKSKSFACIKVDIYGIDSYYGQDGQELATQYNIQYCPTIVFLDIQGNEINRVGGYESADAFLVDMDNALSHSQNSGVDTK